MTTNSKIPTIGPDSVLSRHDRIQIPAMHLPSFRTSLAVQKGYQNNILIYLWGGLGDQISSEPTLRWAAEGGLRGNKVTIATPFPELFSHLKFDDVFDTSKEQPIWDDYLCFETISQQNDSSLNWQFMCHMIVNAVDFPALNAFRFTLPVHRKNIVLKPEEPDSDELLEIKKYREHHVIVHAGRHWPSKTFSKDWWSETIHEIKKAGFIPVLIGKDGGPSQGYVDHDSDGCIDLRDGTSIMESVWLTQQVPIVICNDSSVLHMAASGKAFIGYVATVKEPDYIMHWRVNNMQMNEWAWRMQNFGLGGMWELFDNIPNREETTEVDKVDPKILATWLPKPEVFGPWCKEKMLEYFR